jgi:hypothetical protein
MLLLTTPAMAETYSSSISMSSINFGTLEDGYDMLILTTDGLKEGFVPLANAHTSTGVVTRIKTLSDVGGNTPEAIKDFIREEYQNCNIEYVLLGGDSAAIPVKYVLSRAPRSKTIQIPSDQWYANLNNELEPDPGEIAIGRACVDNAEEVANFVFKTLEYINRDENDYYKVLLVGEDLGNNWDDDIRWGGDYNDQLIDGCSTNFRTVGIPSDKYSINTLYDKDSRWLLEELKNELNDGVYIVNHVGHGASYGVMKMTSHDLTAPVSGLKNTPFFIYTQACNSGAFDEDDSIAEYLTVKTKDNGAFAGIFNTRKGISSKFSIDLAPSQLFNRLFWDAVFGKGVKEIGNALQLSKNAIMKSTLAIRPHMEDIYWGLTLLGDPALTFSEPDVQIMDPFIEITRPEKHHRYENNEDMGYDSKIESCIIVGWVDVTVTAKSFSSSVEKVEFYLDEILEETDYEEPYYWVLNEKSSGSHTIKAVLYTASGDEKSDSIDVEIEKGKGKVFLNLENRFNLLKNIFKKLGFIHHIIPKFFSLITNQFHHLDSRIIGK